jgi:hypothetical protein
MDSTPVDASWPPAVIYALVIVAAVLIGLAWWIWAKGRRLPGEHVFRASRFGRGNHLFPAQVVITPSSLTYAKPQWIGKLESRSTWRTSPQSDRYASIFSDISIETSGGQDPVICQGTRATRSA